MIDNKELLERAKRTYRALYKASGEFQLMESQYPEMKQAGFSGLLGATAELIDELVEKLNEQKN